MRTTHVREHSRSQSKTDDAYLKHIETNTKKYERERYEKKQKYTLYEIENDEGYHFFSLLPPTYKGEKILSTQTITASDLPEREGSQMIHGKARYFEPADIRYINEEKKFIDKQRRKP